MSHKYVVMVSDGDTLRIASTTESGLGTTVTAPSSSKAAEKAFADKDVPVGATVLTFHRREGGRKLTMTAFRTGARRSFRPIQVATARGPANYHSAGRERLFEDMMRTIKEATHSALPERTGPSSSKRKSKSKNKSKSKSKRMTRGESAERW